MSTQQTIDVTDYIDKRKINAFNFQLVVLSFLVIMVDGAALLDAGRAKDAEGVYREELRDLRDNGWALFGLWQSVREQGRSKEAGEIRERFDRAWKNADIVLNASTF